MPIGLALSSILQGALGALGIGTQAGIDARTQRRNVDATNQANMQLAQYQYSKDIEMWNKGNLYNSPEAQMQRLKSAGLNPNLVYGNGAVGNSAGQLPKFNAPQMQYNYRPPVDIPGMLSMFQDFQLKNAQIDNLKEQRSAIQEGTTLKSLQGELLSGTMYDRKQQEFLKAHKLDREQQLLNQKVQMNQQSWPYSLEFIKGRNLQQSSAINKMIQETQLKKLQTDWYTTNIIGGLVGRIAPAVSNMFKSGAKGVKGSFREGKAWDDQKSWSAKKYTDAQQSWNRRRSMEGFYE